MLLWAGGELDPFLHYLDSPSEDYRQGPLARLKEVHPRYAHPYRALLSRPIWMWGAEMGLNERGVAIGNEALFSRRKRDDQGLLGMDMLRLALHNAGDAREALELLAALIEREGQGGNGAYKGKLYYDNSFLIRDPRQAFVLESGGGRWAARPVATLAISNTYRLTDDFTECDTATGQQVYRPGTDEKKRLSFSRRHEHRSMRLLTRGEQRRRRSEYLLDTDGFDLRSAFALLRDHGGARAPRHGMGSICMHPAPLLKNATTASMVVSYTGDEPTAWITAAPHPCVSIFQPWLCSVADTEGPVFTDYSDGEEYARTLASRARALASSYTRWERELRGLREDTESKSVRLLEGTGSTVYSPEEETEEKPEQQEETQAKHIRECRRYAREYWEAAARFSGT